MHAPYRVALRHRRLEDPYASHHRQLAELETDPFGVIIANIIAHAARMPGTRGIAVKRRIHRILLRGRDRGALQRRTRAIWRFVELERRHSPAAKV